MPLTFGLPETLLSTTLAHYRHQLEDNIHNAVPLLYWLNQNGQKEVLDGGVQIVAPLLYEKSTAAGWYSGYGTINTTPQEGISSASYNWKQLAASVSISGKEERQNAGSSRIINLLAAKIQQAEAKMRDLFSSGAAGLGTDAGTSIHGLQSLISTTGTAGGIARAGNTWWQSQARTAASFAANGLDTMRQIFNDCSKFATGDHPDFILTDQTNYERYEKVLQPQERFQDNKLADGGFMNLKFKGVPLTWDTYTLANRMYFINSRYFKLYVQRDADFATGDFIQPENQDARTALILWMGELTVCNSAKHGVMTISAA